MGLAPMSCDSVTRIVKRLVTRIVTNKRVSTLGGALMTTPVALFTRYGCVGARSVTRPEEVFYPFSSRLVTSPAPMSSPVFWSVAI